MKKTAFGALGKLFIMNIPSWIKYINSWIHFLS